MLRLSARLSLFFKFTSYLEAKIVKDRNSSSVEDEGTVKVRLIGKAQRGRFKKTPF